MKKSNLAKQIATIAIIASVFTACSKMDKPDPPITNNETGQTVVKLLNGGAPGFKPFNVDLVNTAQSITLADVRRDVASETDLTKTMTVTVTDDTAALKAYDPSIVYLPSTWYTTNIAKTGGKGGNFLVTFNSGDIAKQITITIPNATLLNPSTTYGLAFTITAADADGHISYNKTLVASIAAKNAWDGLYELKGYFIHPTQVPLGATFTFDDIEMHTVGARSVVMYSQLYADLTHPWLTAAGTTSTFAVQSPQYTVAANGTSITVENAPAYVAQGGSVYSDKPGYPKRYDPASRTFYAAYGYSGLTRLYIDTLRYLGPR